VRLDADARGVFGVERPIRGEEADVMARVPGRRKALEANDAVAGDVDVLLGDGRQLPSELVERVAVQPARACTTSGTRPLEAGE